MADVRVCLLLLLLLMLLNPILNILIIDFDPIFYYVCACVCVCVCVRLLARACLFFDCMFPPLKTKQQEKTTRNGLKKNKTTTPTVCLHFVETAQSPLLAGRFFSRRFKFGIGGKIIKKNKQKKAPKKKNADDKVSDSSSSSRSRRS